MARVTIRVSLTNAPNGYLPTEDTAGAGLEGYLTRLTPVTIAPGNISMIVLRAFS